MDLKMEPSIHKNHISVLVEKHITMPDIRSSPSLSTGHSTIGATHQTQATLTPQPARAQGVSKPGCGVLRFNDERLELRALNQSGFVSGFRSDKCALLRERSERAIPFSDIQNCWAQKAQLSARAHAQMEQLHTVQLNNHPQQLHGVMNATYRQINRHPEKALGFARALQMYREANGGFYLMNIHAMKFEKLSDYVAARDTGKTEPDTVSDFLFHFCDGYNPLPHHLNGEEITERDQNIIQGRFDNEYKWAAETLIDSMHNAETLSDVVLMKGVGGEDDASSTQVNGR